MNLKQTRANMKQTGKWSMTYKVIRGERNFSTGRALEVAELTGTDPLIWMDRNKAHLRARHASVLKTHFGVISTKQQPHKRGGKK